MNNLTHKFAIAVSLILSVSTLSYGQGNTFKKIRYQGGSVASTVKADDWGNKLTVSPEAITLQFKDGKVETINPKTVTGLSYGQEAHRRVGTMIALAVLVAPVALFGLFHKTRKHYIGFEWQEEEKKNGVLLQADKEDYRGVLMALRGVTGAPVAVSEEERKYVPTGIEVANPKPAVTEKGGNK